VHGVHSVCGDIVLVRDSEWDLVRKNRREGGYTLDLAILKFCLIELLLWRACGS
jgi:hypothetical protein